MFLHIVSDFNLLPFYSLNIVNKNRYVSLFLSLFFLKDGF